MVLRARSTPVDDLGDVRICFFGDSLTHGQGDEQELGWAGRVALATRARGVELTAYRLGVCAETTQDIGRRWRSEWSVRSIEGATARLVVACGTNDVFREPWTGAGPARDALAAMLVEAVRDGLRPLVLGPPPVGDPSCDERAVEVTSAFAQACAQLDGVTFVDVHAPLRAADSPWREALAQGDGAHPVAAGYDALAAVLLDGAWWPWLEVSAPEPVAGPGGA